MPVEGTEVPVDLDGDDPAAEVLARTVMELLGREGQVGEA